MISQASLYARNAPYGKPKKTKSDFPCSRQLLPSSIIPLNFLCLIVWIWNSNSPTTVDEKLSHLDKRIEKEGAYVDWGSASNAQPTLQPMIPQIQNQTEQPMDTHSLNIVESFESPSELLLSIKPRAFEYYQGDELPCFPPNPRWTQDSSPSTIGLLFAKPFKTGSSTAAGIHARISRNVADRLGKNYSICSLRWQHSYVQAKYANRTKSKSLLWTILRDPTSRLISLFYHFKVARFLLNATTQNFVQVYMGEYTRSQRDYYLRSQSSLVTKDRRSRIESIIQDMDFVGITERFDESVVALSILWKIPLADVLYLPAKRLGSWDGGGGGWGCHKIVKSQILPGMQEFMDSTHFQKLVEYDNVAYRLANQSLDLTIERTIGREKFDKALARFRHAKQIVTERCANEVQYPCDDTLKPLPISPNKRAGPHIVPRSYKDTDCLVQDTGCGYMCIDEVATELGLWDERGGLEYKFPGAFGLGPSTQQRLKTKLNENAAKEGNTSSDISNDHNSLLGNNVSEWRTGFEDLEVPREALEYELQKTERRSMGMKMAMKMYNRKFIAQKDTSVYTGSQFRGQRRRDGD